MQLNDAPIEIQNSRTKLAGLFVISLLFVSVGLWMTLKPQGMLFGSTDMVRVVGVAAIVFFGLACVFMLKQLGNKKPVIIISFDGITDRSSATSVGFIPWSDITEIRETMVMNQSFMTIDVKNPEHYISEQTNSVKRKLMQLNFDKYNSLISISANSLQCKQFQLRHLLQSEFKNYQARTNQS